MNTNPFRIDRYELQELLEQGGRAEVWKAFDTQARRYVAVKFLHANLQADPEYPSRFQREVQALTYLRHPNIVQYFDFSLSPPVGSGNITACIVMDYVDGGTLADYIRTTSRQGSFPSPIDIERVFLPLCSAVAFAHQHGMVHGQLKPTNVLLDKRNTVRVPMGELVVTDFGMTRLYGAGTSNINSWYSTPMYLSPEQLMGSPADARSDIYSLGIMLYEVCTGTPPFPGSNAATIITQHINVIPASPSLMNPTMPPALVEVIMRCIAKSPSTRFPDVSSLMTALTEALGQWEKEAAGISPVPSVSSPEYAARTVDHPTMMSAGLPAAAEGTVPAALTPSSPGTSGASYHSLPTPASGGLAAAFYRASSPGLVGSSPPFSALQAGVTSAASTPGQAAQSSPAGYSPAPSSTPVIPPSPPSPGHRPRRRGLWIALLVLLVLIVVGAGLASSFGFFAKGSSPNTAVSSTVGHAYFASSGLLSSNPDRNQGITDQVQVKLNDVSPPPSGMAYYAWLLNDKTKEWNPLYLGALTVNNGTAVLSYADPQFTNLLATNSRFLVTEESAAAPPVSPSLHPSAWRYYAEFSQVPDPNNSKHYSLYDHIRHLLSADPNVAETGLSGGLDIWLYRNTQKILEWAGSARDAQQSGNTAFIRRQLTRIMDYLDGTSSTQLAQDLPGQPVLADPQISKVGLLTFDPAKQTLPGYLYHSTKHVGEIALLPQSSPEQKTLATQINQKINVVNAWFETMRTEVLHLYHMSDAQLLGSNGRSLLDSVATLANTAFVGEINSQGQVTPGVAQIHYDIQKLATFDVRACTTSDPCKLI